MGGLRDYEQWHDAYDDAGSGLSQRLREVQRLLGAALDRTAGPVRVVSACAGGGRDVLSALTGRADRERVEVTLVEINETLAAAARVRAAPSLCRPGATVISSRGRTDTELTERIRVWFGTAGFTELDHVRIAGERTAVLGVLRYDGPPVPLVPSRPLFTFVR